VGESICIDRFFSIICCINCCCIYHFSTDIIVTIMLIVDVIRIIVVEVFAFRCKHGV